jgi:hypothetical protein
MMVFGRVPVWAGHNGGNTKGKLFTGLILTIGALNVAGFFTI